MDAETLRAILSYDCETGEFRWRCCFRGIAAGSKAGTLRSGYVSIGWQGKHYGAHRLAWLYVHGGELPDRVDHKDGNRANNRIANLRPCTQGENLQNQRRAKSHSASGLLGVSWHNGNSSWRATIVVDGKQRTLGYFDDKHTAHAAYLSAKRELHPFSTV